MSAAASTCPDWCDDHLSLSDVDVHQSRLTRVGDHVVMLAGADEIGPGGVFYFHHRDGMPERPMSLPTASAVLAGLVADLETRAAEASALARAIEDLQR